MPDSKVRDGQGDRASGMGKVIARAASARFANRARDSRNAHPV